MARETIRGAPVSKVAEASVMKRAWMILLCATAAGAQSEAHWVLLPASAAAEAGQQCSRGAPKVEGGWLPAAADVAALEQHLPQIAALEGGIEGVSLHIAYPENFYRQYVGIVVGGRRLIYVNAGPYLLTGPNREHVAVACDGGSRFWGALYDPRAGRFFNLQINGPYSL